MCESTRRGVKMSGETRGREVGQPTIEIRAMFEKHGPLTYKEALPYIEKMSDEVRAYYTESTNGKNQGSNRYNVAKAGWNKSKGNKVKAKKVVAKAAKVKAGKVAKVTKTRRIVAANDPMTEVMQMGGLKALNAEIARLQGLKDAVESILAKVA